MVELTVEKNTFPEGMVKAGETVYWDEDGRDLSLKTKSGEVVFLLEKSTEVSNRVVLKMSANGHEMLLKFAEKTEG